MNLSFSSFLELPVDSIDRLNLNHEKTPYIAYLHALAIIKNEKL
jgi:hypothetical protein